MSGADAGRYDPVAHVFARLSRQYTTPVASRLVSLARFERVDRVLDLGTGTGVVALQAAQALGPPGYVVGVDTAARMLDEARAAAGDLRHVAFLEGDAAGLPLEAQSFDAVVSLFAFAHFPDPAAALREAHRVLRPGGRLTLGAGGAPALLSTSGLGAAARRVPVAWRTWRGLCLVAPRYMESTLARRGARLAHAPSLSPDTLGRLARHAGFSGVRLSWHGGAASVETPEEFWELQAVFSTPARLWLAEAGAAEAASLRRDVLEAGARVLARGGRLLYSFGVCFLEAHRS